MEVLNVLIRNSDVLANEIGADESATLEIKEATNRLKATKSQYPNLQTLNTLGEAYEKIRKLDAEAGGLGHLLGEISMLRKKLEGSAEEAAKTALKVLETYQHCNSMLEATAKTYDGFLDWFQSTPPDFPLFVAIAFFMNSESKIETLWPGVDMSDDFLEPERRTKIVGGLWNAYNHLCGTVEVGEECHAEDDNTAREAASKAAARARRESHNFEMEVSLFLRLRTEPKTSLQFATFWKSHKPTLTLLWELCRAVFCLRCSTEEAEKQLREMQDSRPDRSMLKPQNLLQQQLARTRLKMRRPSESDESGTVRPLVLGGMGKNTTGVRQKMMGLASLWLGFFGHACWGRVM